MAQVALGAVGAVIGTIIAPGIGTSIGWALGSIAGGVLFPPKGPHSEGPRLTDLKQTVSAYGAPKPLIFGRAAPTGAHLWSADVVEVVTEEGGGKGEPTSSSTTYSYFWSGAILIAKSVTPAGYHSLLRIFVNGECFYDVRDPTNSEAIIASSVFATYFTWYPGTYTQMPDPTMEAELGVGNVPGYRGRSYIVFHGLPLELFNNYPPGALNFQFEIQRLADTTTGIQIIADNNPMYLGVMYPVTDGTVRTGTFNDPARDIITGIYRATDGTLIVSEEESELESEWPMAYYDWYINGFGVRPAERTLAVMLMYDGSTVRAFGPHDSLQISSANSYLYAELGGQGGAVIDGKVLFDDTQYFRAVIPAADRRHILVITSGASLAMDAWKMIAWDGDAEDFVVVSTGTVPLGFTEPHICIGNASQGLQYYSGMVESDLRYVWTIAATSGPQIRLHWINDSDELEFIEVYAKSPIDPFSFSASCMWADDGLAYANTGGFYNLFTRLPQAGDNEETLDLVTSELCTHATLTPSQIVVTQLEPYLVDGFMVSAVGAARAALVHLERTYWFDSIETGGQIKFVVRGQSSVVTIPQADLGAYEADHVADDLVVNDRADEDSLVGEINVAYLTKDAAYQIGVQSDQREATVTTQPTNVELPLVLSDLKAKQVAAVLLYDSWLGRTRRSFKTSRKYSYLEPTDVVTLELDDATYVVRIISMRINGGILEFDSVDEDDAIYDPNSVAGPIIDPNPGITLVGPTMIALLDIPLLRTEDSNAGFYVAAAGYFEDWAGYRLFVSNDGGATYNAISASSSACTMGTVTNTLGDHTGGNYFDTENTITVSLLHGTLSSITDAELYAGGNACAVGTEANGWEILQFKTATLTSPGSYTLSQLLRGRKGTEFRQGDHVGAERFVLLTTAMIRVAGEVSSLNTARLYKGVTFMQSVADASARSFTNTGAALKPYTVVHVTISRDTGTGNMTIEWIRRGRINNEWLDGVDVPLSEATEAYEIDIYDGVTFKRTLTSTTQSVAYSAANETTDFGSPQTEHDLRIYQMSADVGRGFGFIDTVPVVTG